MPKGIEVTREVARALLVGLLRVGAYRRWGAPGVVPRSQELGSPWVFSGLSLGAILAPTWSSQMAIGTEEAKTSFISSGLRVILGLPGASAQASATHLG
eukprot:2490411-Pyramimonas_sp.AAC.1